MAPPPTISLCMIVRDEEELLPRFLAAARGAWDELVAVDTGSLDATPRLLRQAGARLLQDPWRGDFARARNVGLEAARGDLVLFLDADELTSPDLVRSLRAVSRDPSVGAASLLFRDALEHGQRRESWLLRLFRRDPSIRFRHAIHESVDEPVEAYLSRAGLSRVRLGGHVDHLGYGRARARARGKRARDAAILERCLAEDADDLYAHFKLLEQARFWGDRGLWARAAAPAASAIERAPGRLGAAHFGGELLALVAEGLHRGAPRAALDYLRAWGARAPPSAPLLLARGLAAEEAGLLEEAARDFAACAAVRGDAISLRATLRPLLGLARIAAARGDAAGAESQGGGGAGAGAARPGGAPGRGPARLGWWPRGPARLRPPLARAPR